MAKQIIIMQSGNKFAYVALDTIKENIWDDKKKLITRLQKEYGRTWEIIDETVSAKSDENFTTALRKKKAARRPKM